VSCWNFTASERTAKVDEQKPAVVTPSEAVLKARERGGRLRVFGNSHQGPVELGKAVEFDDFRTLVASPFGWSARRKGGDTYCMAGLETSHAGPAVELGPFLTSFLQRGKVPVMQMRTDGSCRNLFSNGGSQHRKEWADHRAIAFLNPGNYILSIDSDGKILRGEHWYGAKMTDRIPPPEDFFLGARAYTTVRDHYISARPGLPVRSFSAKTGQIIDFPSSIQEIVEMDATADEQVIMRDASGQVFVVTPDGKPHGTVPPDIGPSVAVRAGANMFAAQRTDGTWRAWGEADGLVAQTDRVGHAVDIDFHSEDKGKISYMLWIEPVDATAPQPPAKTSVSTSPAMSQREIAERLLGLKAELRIRQPGKLTRVIFGDKLPESDFAIYEITFPMTAKATDETFALVAGVPDLERLRVNGRISTLSPVAGLNKLIELNIYSSGSDPDDGNSLSEEEMRHLEGLTQLESLTMGIKGFTGQGCRHLRGAAKLTKLFLGQKGETARPIDEAGAAVIARLTSLTSLSLRGNVFAPASSAAFRTIVAMPNLTTLDLGDTTITREMLLEIGKMPKLQSLNLSTCRLETQEFSLLAPCAGHLTALSFGYDTDLSDAGVKEIADTLVNLKEFHLGWTNACTGAALHELARLPKLHDLRLQKRDGLIKPEDYVALTQFPVLNQLSLVSCGLTDDCLKTLGRCPNLAAVTLTSNDKITDTALNHLHSSKTIRYVEVTGTQVTEAGIAALKQALPGCEVKR
jgi:hypothetical protein